MELKYWAETCGLQRRGSVSLRSLLGFLSITDFGAELRCCVEYLESKVLVEGKKGNVVAKLFL